jgi:hypothetical protein
MDSENVVFIHNGMLFNHKERNFIICRKMNGTGEIKLVSLRRPKIICSPSFVDYRPKINAVILLDMDHTLRGDCAQEE